MLVFSILSVAQRAHEAWPSPGHGRPRAERFREPLTETAVTRLAALLEAPQDCVSSVPLIVAGAIRGILVVLRLAAPQDPDQDEWLLSALADHAAVALETNRLNQLGEFREQLIGIVGHDLRTPLSMILMGAQVLLEREGLGAYETEIARKITTSAGLATRLISQRSANPSRGEGLGLGLFIAQQIARSHGGSIAVSSSENDGTSFRVSLPRVLGDAMLK